MYVCPCRDATKQKPSSHQHSIVLISTITSTQTNDIYLYTPTIKTNNRKKLMVSECEQKHDRIPQMPPNEVGMTPHVYSYTLCYFATIGHRTMGNIRVSQAGSEAILGHIVTDQHFQPGLQCRCVRSIIDSPPTACIQ